MPKPPRRAIRKIVDYLWGIELKHFEENMLDADTYLHGHIFNDVEIVKNWLDGKEPRNG